MLLLLHVPVLALLLPVLQAVLARCLAPLCALGAFGVFALGGETVFCSRRVLCA